MSTARLGQIEVVDDAGANRGWMTRMRAPYSTIENGLLSLPNSGVWHSQGVMLYGTHPQMDGNIGEPSVIYEGSPQILTAYGKVFKMWFTAGWNTPSIWYAESPDAMPGSWVVRPAAVISNRLRFRAIHVGSTYYGYAATTTGSRIDRFTSTDGITWTQTHAGVIVPSGTGWESTNVQSSCVVVDGSTWLMFYDGGDGASYSTGLATSTDLGITWVKDAAHNPIIPNSGRVHVHKVNGFYHAWGQYIPPVAILPSDIYRWSAPAPTGPWTRTTSPTYPRATGDEGVNTSLGQVGDLSIIEVNGRTYLFHVKTYDGSSVVGSRIGLAISNLPLASLVLTNEGRNFSTAGMNAFQGPTGYTPIIGSTANAITTAGATSGQFQIINGRCFFELDGSITVNGTGGGQVTFTLPAKASGFNYAVQGFRADLGSAAVLRCSILPGGTTVQCLFDDGTTYPGADGARIIVSGSFVMATS